MLDTSPDSPAMNAYCTLDEAEAYMATLAFKKAWEGKGDGQKEAAIIQAARWMDTLAWKGQKTDGFQPLAWPREYATDGDGRDIPNDAIPQRIKEANAEFALRLLESDRAVDGKKGVSLGAIKTPDKERRLVPESVMDLAGPYLAIANANWGSVHLVRC